MQAIRGKESIYLDTSVPSAYFDDREPARKALTREFWGKLGSYDVFISSIVLEELSAVHDEVVRSQLLGLVKGFHVLELSEEVERLAEAYIKEGIFPRRFRDDARHVAIAAVNGIDYLASWNFKHVVKVKTRRMVNLVNLMEGFKSLEIVAPPEL